MPYSDNQAEDMIGEAKFMAAFDEWTGRFASFVRHKGKIEPGRYRAFGHEAPGHKRADVKLKWCELRMEMGVPPASAGRAAEVGAKAARVT